MRFTLLNLGRKGISIAASPLAIEDGALLSAQNAELLLDGNDGGLAKRKGIGVMTPLALDGDVFALFSGGLFFPPELDPDTLEPQALGGGA